MTFINRKKLASFFLLIILVSQVCVEEAVANPLQETHKASVSQAKIISSEIAIKPTGALQETISRAQHQLILNGVNPIPSLKNFAIENKQHGFFLLQAYHSKTFLINRVLRI